MAEKQRPSKREFQAIATDGSDVEEEDADKDEEKYWNEAIGDKSQAQGLPLSVVESYQNSGSLIDQKSRKKAVNELNDDDPHSVDSDSISNENEDSDPTDLSHSTRLLCRITLFMYLFVIILIYSNFPVDGNVDTKYSGWFSFFLWIDIIACLVGMTGNVLTKPRLLYICWVTLTISLVLVGVIVIIYTTDQGTEADAGHHGVGIEAQTRCSNWTHDDSFEYTSEQCLEKMKVQLTWTVGLLYVIYAVIGMFGIQMVKRCEKQMEELMPEKYDEALQDDLISDLSSDFDDDRGFDDDDGFEVDEYDIVMEDKKRK